MLRLGIAILLASPPDTTSGDKENFPAPRKNGFIKSWPTPAATSINSLRSDYSTASQGINTQDLKVALSGQQVADADDVNDSVLRVRSNLPADRRQGLRFDPFTSWLMISAVFTCPRANAFRARGSSARLHQLI